jgi:hypothetical protein
MRDIDFAGRPICRQHRGIGVPGACIAAIAIIGAYGVAQNELKAKTAGHPAPKVVVRTVTKTVAGHPVLSGTDMVLIVLCIAVAVVAVVALRTHRPPWNSGQGS